MMRYIEILQNIVILKIYNVPRNDIDVYTSTIGIKGSFLPICFSELQIHYSDYSIKIFSNPSNVEIQT